MIMKTYSQKYLFELSVCRILVAVSVCRILVAVSESSVFSSSPFSGEGTASVG